MNIRAKIYGSSAGEEPILAGKRPKGAKADALHSIQVRREESRRSNNRKGDRHRLSQEAVGFTHDGVSGQADLINLSSGGAMLRGAFDVMLWDRVDLHLGENGTMECAVRWIRGDRIGLEFAHETRLDCSDDDLGAVLRQVITRSFPDLEFDESQPELEEEDEEHRRAPRHPLIWSGVLHYDYERGDVRIRNISATGAMIQCSLEVAVGSQPVLEISNAKTLSSTVQWVVGDQIGLRFDEPFDLRLLAQARPQVAGASQGHGDAAAPFPSDAGDPWEKQWNRLTVPQLRTELEGFSKD